MNPSSRVTSSHATAKGRGRAGAARLVAAPKNSQKLPEIVAMPPRGLLRCAYTTHRADGKSNKKMKDAG
jgi:hypothetical protein